MTRCANTAQICSKVVAKALDVYGRDCHVTPVAAPRNSCCKCEYRLKLVQIIYDDFYKTLEDPRFAKCIGADIVSILDRP